MALARSSWMPPIYDRCDICYEQAIPRIKGLKPIVLPGNKPLQRTVLWKNLDKDLVARAHIRHICKTCATTKAIAERLLRFAVSQHEAGVRAEKYRVQQFMRTIIPATEPCSHGVRY